MYQRIRDLRDDADLTQTQMAEILKISQATYSRYENGTLDLPTATLIALADFHNVSVDYLLGRTDEP
ncbi:MAG: helix-turn-helix transcriptional regulator [Oscillospiraceae bacterium]|jgi:transcriptional regulator with XRE-family HTH domain|nr:helix-turn-helix transcriptional regulator [Oscillospiraceae bacterium]